MLFYHNFSFFIDRKVIPLYNSVYMKKTASVEEIPSPKEEHLPKKELKKDSEYLTIPIPRLRIKDFRMNNVYIFVLFVLGFLLGMLTTKVQYMDKLAKADAEVKTAQAAQLAAVQQNNAPSNPTPQTMKVDNGHLPILGNANAKVTMVEFSDFQCPYCKQFFTNTESQIINQYVNTGKVKLVYRQFPLPFHPNAHVAAEASECANEQNKFWEYHNLLFQKQNDWVNIQQPDVLSTFTDYAGQLGLNTDQFSSCVTSGKYKKKVDDDMNAGNTAGVTGTPTFAIDGNVLVGAEPLATFQAAIDKELAKK